MDQKQFQIRSQAVVAVLAVLLLCFSGVLYDLQVVHGREYMEKSTRKIANTELVQAARGEFLDRYGRVLVGNKPVYQVTLDTKLMGDTQGRNETILALVDLCRDQGVEWDDELPVTKVPPFRYTEKEPFLDTYRNEDGSTTKKDSMLRRLVDALKLKNITDQTTAEEFVAALRAYFEVEDSVETIRGRELIGVLYGLTLRNKDISRSSYIFAQDVDIDFITAVKEQSLSGVRIETVTVRDYVTPYAGHILGQVGPIYAEEKEHYQELGYNMNEIVGKFGVEEAFESYVRGTPGVKDVELSQSGKVVREDWHVDLVTGEKMMPNPGDHPMLTLDIKLQEAVEKALARHIPGMTEESEKGACVITDMTGGILAIASYPSYPAGEYYSNYKALSQDPRQPLFNRALQGLYAPGSTFKPAVAIGGLEEGVITTTEKILDTGRYLHYDRIEDQPMCWYFRQYGKTHGKENVSEAIRDSCNIYFYETGLRMGIDAIDTYAALFGFGKPTGLELYEKSGEVAGPATSAKHGQPWYEGDTMYAAIGQGNTQVTPIQLANYVTTLVNGGYHYPTHLLKAVKSSDFSEIVEEYRPEPIDVVQFQPENLEAVKQGMYMAATEGTAAPYFKDLPVSIGIKTGSAQVSRNSEAHALMIAFAPYENPEIAISIVVEHGGSGTKVASIAADILDYYFSAKDTMDRIPAENTMIR